MQGVTIALVLVGSLAVATAAPARRGTVELGAPTTSAQVDREPLDRVVRARTRTLLRCYEQAMEVDPGVEGTATATFTIGRDGKVADVAVTGLTRESEACIVKTISTLRFARRGAAVEVSYPLRYAPTHEPAPASLQGMPRLGGGLDVDAAAALIAPAGFTRLNVSTVSLGAVRVTGGAGPSIVRRYLQRSLHSVAPCYDAALSDHPTLEGTVTVALTLGGDGAVTAATVAGLGDATVETCVASVFQAMAFPRSKAGASAVTVPVTMRPATRR